MLESIINSAFLLAAIAWLIRKLAEQVLSKDIENYKNNLKLITIEHQIIYKNLYERRAKVIADIYSLMINAIHAVEKFVSPNINYEGKIDLYDHTMKQILKFSNYFDKNRIFLSNDLCEIIEDAINELKQPTFDLHNNAQLSKYNKDDLDVWIKSWEKVKNKKIPSVRQKLEEEFRFLLGVHDKKIK